MIRDITIGQYYQEDSIVHRLDPRTKIVVTLLYMISLFLVESIIGYGVILVLLLSVIKLSKVPLGFIVKGLRPLLIILLFTVSFNLFFTRTGEVLFEFWIVTITDEGIQSAAMMASRLILLIMGSNIVTLTTTPNLLTDGIESLLNPLKVVKMPVHEIAMMMAIALRFIPILLEETDKIMKAQLARGADFESGNILRRAKNMIPILVPLFISAFRRANDLALAMEARCYRGGAGRTKMKPLSYKKRDYATYGMVLLYMAIVISAKVLDVTSLIKAWV